MIQTKNIRLGNWVIHSQNALPLYDSQLEFSKRKPMMVTNKILVSLLNDKSNCAFYDYVQLNENILASFGFTHHEFDKDINSFNFDNFKTNGVYGEITLIKGGVNGFFEFQFRTVFLPKIKYLHELQNSFFILNGRFELNHIVAYNHYLYLHKKLTNFDGSLPFSKFVEIVENPTKNHPTSLKSTSICEFMPKYCLGDLPENLFQL